MATGYSQRINFRLISLLKGFTVLEDHMSKYIGMTCPFGPSNSHKNITWQFIIIIMTIMMMMMMMIAC